MNSFLEQLAQHWGPGELDVSVWQLAGWTMCCFLVVGTVVAVAGAVLRLACRRAAPGVRYGISLATLIVLALLPLGIAGWLVQSVPTVPLQVVDTEPVVPNIIELKEHIVPPSGRESLTVSSSEVESEFSHTEGGAIYGGDAAVEFVRPEGGAMSVRTEGLVTLFRVVLAWLPWVWILGAPVTFSLLATGLVGSARLRRRCEPIVAGLAYQTCERLRGSLRVTRQVSIAVCDRIAQPVLVGIVRPLILLPPAALTGWSPEELEMVLLHELTHVRRWDNLVNLGQRMVESVLFFHPAVWLVSRQVRRDREQCCDAVVVARTAKPQAYAELLISIAAVNGKSATFATASALADHPLAGRIRRILNLEEEPMLVSRSTLGGFTLAVATLVAVLLWQPTAKTVAEDGLIAEVAESAEGDLLSTEGTEEEDSAAEVVGDAEKLPVDKIYEPGKTMVQFFPHPTSPKVVDAEVRKLNRIGHNVTVRPTDNGTALLIENGVLEFARTMNDAILSPDGPPLPFAGELETLKKVIREVEEEIVFNNHELANTRARFQEKQGTLRFRSENLSLNEQKKLKEEINTAKEALSIKQKEVDQFSEVLESLRKKYNAIQRTSKADTTTESADKNAVPREGQVFRIDADSTHREVDAVVKRIKTAGLGVFVHKKPVGVVEIHAVKADPSSAAVVPERPLFLPLEEQRAVDFAYKTLGVELAEIHKAQSERLKGSVFEGGLEILTSSNQGGVTNGDPLLKGDILVGLHSWPTKSLADVVEILQRDDIRELSPLKFFVLRKPSGEDGDAVTTSHGDAVITGRVEVNLSALHSGQASKTGGSKAARKTSSDSSPFTAKKTVPGDALLLHAEGAFPDQPIQDVYLVEPAGTLALGPTYGRVAVAGMTLSKAEAAVTEHLKKILADPTIQITWADIKNSASTLLYDGKTFEEWRQMWKTELKTEKRTECIQALAAFGRAGRAEEAVEAILDVAGEYDFRTIDSTSEGKLKQAVIDQVLKFPSSIWLGRLLERYDSDGDTWKYLADFIFFQFHREKYSSYLQSGPTKHTDVERQTELYNLAKSGHAFRNFAAAALYRGDPALQHAETVEVMRRSLTSSQPDMQVFHQLGFRHLDRVPEQFDLLFHEDQEVRQSARRNLGGTSIGWGLSIESGLSSHVLNTIKESSITLAHRFLKTLSDPEQASKHLYAIRALGSVQNKLRIFNEIEEREDIVMHLKRVIIEGDEELLGPALAAIERCGSNVKHTVQNILKEATLNEVVLTDEREKLLSDAESIMKLVQEEHQANSTPTENKGGGFF